MRYIPKITETGKKTYRRSKNTGVPSTTTFGNLKKIISPEPGLCTHRSAVRARYMYSAIQAANRAPPGRLRNVRTKEKWTPKIKKKEIGAQGKP